MSVIGGGAAGARSTPGTWARIIAPGLKPSLRFHSVGSMCTPSTLAGIDARLKLTRRPVSVLGSATVKRSLGNGSRQRFWPRSRSGRRRTTSMPGSHEMVAGRVLALGVVPTGPHAGDEAADPRNEIRELSVAV